VDARNQDRKGEAALRTIHGSVLDKSENPVPSSVVYLLNVKTQAVKTYIADDAGAYRFSGLDPNVDYEVHAEHNDMTSSNRTVSSFDSRHDIEVTLKLSRKKPPH
jgi:protocatechuate 3,4-dioxygenase beta subunit